MKLNIRSEQAVSPVIGVILMVAITIILAAVVAAFVFSTAGNFNQSYLVSVTASQITSENIDVTYRGGPDHDSVEWINISIGDTKHNEFNPCVGYTWPYTGGSSARDHVIVVGHFVDGSEQVILDTYV